MEVNPDNIIVNSCEYTPVYLIPATSVTQAGSYILAPSPQNSSKPLTDNLKIFYENSGNIENSILTSPKPRILKRQTPTVVGNNLKLASFLIPKSSAVSVQKEYIPITTTIVNTTTSNIVLKPVVTTVSTNVTSVMAPRVEVDRKIVRVGKLPLKKRNNPGRVLPKIKPKENPVTLNQNLPKLTSVQLLKYGGAYHSLSQLSDEQMKVIDKALKLFSEDPQKMPNELAYDPVTNTKFLYKIVSPRDLAVVGKNKLEHKLKKTEMRKQILKKMREDIIEVKEEPCEMRDENREESVPVEPTVTRSGRTVKIPKQIVPEDSPPQKPRKKNGNLVNCFQCSAEFGSFYRLQRHYELYPTHIPANIHSNLFHCLLAIINSGSGEDKANIFIQQLEQLIDKLKSLMPCLLKVNGEGKTCNLNEDVARLFGLDPGKYNLNLNAVGCVKDKDGYCAHNPAPKPNQINADVSKPSQLWLSKHNEEIANEAETEDCARIKSVDKWPIAKKRIWKLKQHKSPKLSAKRIKLASESEPHIELGTEDIAKKDESAIFETQNNIHSKETNNEVEETTELAKEDSTTSENQSKIPISTPIKFRSAHFDIRSSPIKLPSALVKKFQLDPEKPINYQVQIMQPLDLNKANGNTEIIIQPASDNVQIFRDSDMAKESIMDEDLSFNNPKWTISAVSEHDQSHDSFIQSNVLFESGLTPIKQNNLIKPSLIHMDNKTNNLFESTSQPSNVIEPILIQAKPNNLVEPPLLQLDDKTNGLFEPSPIVVKSDSSLQSLLHTKGISNGLYEALTRAQIRSTLFEPIPLKENDLIGQSNNKEEINFFEAFTQRKHADVLVEPVTNSKSDLGDLHLIPINGHKKSISMIEPPVLHLEEKSSVLFEALSRVKERSNSLFEPMPTKGKNTLIGPSMINIKDKSGFYENFQTKRDSLTEPMIHNEILINDSKSAENIDISQSDLNTSSQGQSVLNFLESLGNECLAYPETEIRNNDFQLDLFSFNSS